MKFPTMFCLLFCAIAPASAIDRHTLEQVLVLANQGNAEAQYHAGMLYNNGVGGADKDPQRAFEWFRKSADGNDPLGAYKVGCYYAGQFSGTVPVDEEKALAYKLVAAKAGYSLAQQDVASTYGRRGNFAEAEKWWKLAADQANEQAAYNLSVMYYKGQGVSQNLPLTYAYFKLAKLISEKRVNPKAQSFLDEIAGKLTPQDIEKAESFVSGWVANPSALTVKAGSGAAALDAMLKTR